MKVLQSNDAFSNVPVWLQEIPRWILWRASNGKKIPCSVTTGKHVDITDNTSMGWEFLQAVQAVNRHGATGIGIILNGDGLVAVDLDDCLTESGNFKEGVEQILTNLAGGFVEVSPSGRGLHIFGIADHPKHTGVRKEVEGVSVELYCQARYMTVTGRLPLRSHASSASSQMPGYMALLASAMADREPASSRTATQLTQETQDVQDIQDTQDIQARVGGFPDISQMPSSCRLERAGNRNAKCFELARWLKAVAPHASLDQLKPIVSEWHQMHLDVMETKEFSETWIDFTCAWNKVKFPYGQTLDELFKQLPELPWWMEGHDLGVFGDKLLRFCVKLDERKKGTPFILAGHALAPYFGCSRQHMYNIINAATNCGYIERISVGRRGQAAEYQLFRRPKT